MKRKLITLILATTVSSLFFSTTVYADDDNDKQVYESSEEIVSPDEAAETEAVGEDTEAVGEDIEVIEETEQTEENTTFDENPDELSPESFDEIVEDSPETSTEFEEESSEIVEVIEKTHEYLCTVNITYKKEYCEAYFEGAETTLVELSSSFEVPEGASYTIFFDDVSEKTIKAILDECNLPEFANTGFDISAKIDIAGNITIESILETAPKEVVTECVVQLNEVELEDDFEADVNLDDILTQLNSMSESEVESAIANLNMLNSSED